jgi:uncharacterized protein YegP (UPF0339 family)
VGPQGLLAHRDQEAFGSRESYESKASALKGIEWVKRNTPGRNRSPDQELNLLRRWSIRR